MDYLDLIRAWICTASLTFAFVLAFVILFLRRRRRRPRRRFRLACCRTSPYSTAANRYTSCLSSAATIGSTTRVVASADLSSRSISVAGARTFAMSTTDRNKRCRLFRLVSTPECGVSPLAGALVEIEPPTGRVYQRVGVAAGDGVDEADGSAEGVAMSALTLQAARSRSSRGWMDCSWRTMSSSCCRSTALGRGPDLAQDDADVLRLVDHPYAGGIDLGAGRARHTLASGGRRGRRRSAPGGWRELRSGEIEQADGQDAYDYADDEGEGGDPPAGPSLDGTGGVIGSVLRIGASHLAPPRMERLDDLRS